MSSGDTYGFFLERMSRGVLCRVSGVVLALISIIVGTHPVYADPHAVFYTTVGQQQLFFNVLAALDQADYVETDAQRQQLVAQRQAAAPATTTPEGLLVQAFTPESYPAITATEAQGFSSILSRLATLEGNDLYTDFLVRSFALEASRRRASEEVIDIYCQESLGRPGCREPNPNIDPVAWFRAPADRERAYVGNVQYASNEPLRQGAIGVLNSGTLYDQFKRQALVADSYGDQFFLQESHQYDSFLAELTLNTSPFTVFETAVERVKGGVENMLHPLRVDPEVFNGLAVDPSTGRVFAATDNIDTLTGILTQLTALPVATLESAMAGMGREFDAQAVRINNGSRADVELLAYTGQFGEAKTITASALAPAAAKGEARDALIQGINDVESNLAYADPDAERQPGQPELVRRRFVSGARTDVASSAEPTRQGDVAGTLTTTGQIHDLTVSYPLGNYSPFHHGQGPQHGWKFLQFTNPLTIAQEGGCNCNQAAVVQALGPKILNDINAP